MNDAHLTEKELNLLNRFRRGMDAANEGWLHEMEIYNGKELSGLVSSLVKKGCIQSDFCEGEDMGAEDAYWITVKPEWHFSKN
jgi:hypothetical protein